MPEKNNKEKKKIDEFKKHEKEIENLIAQKKFQEAYKRLKKLNKDYKDYSRLYLLWGDYCKGKKDYNNAEKWYIRAINIDKNEKVDDILWRGVHESGDALYFYSYLELFHTNMGNE